MKYRIILFLGFFFSKNIQSQTVQSIDNFLEKYYEQKAFDQNTMQICDSLLASKSLDDVAISTVLTLKGHIFKTNNKDKKALFFYKKALFLREKHFKNGSELTAKAYRNLGSFYFQMNDLVKAKAFFQKANDMILTYCGKDAAEQIEPLKGLAKVEKKQEHSDEAIVLLEKADLIQIKNQVSEKEKLSVSLPLFCLYVEHQKDINLAKKQLATMPQSAFSDIEFLYYKSILEFRENHFFEAINTLSAAQKATSEYNVFFYKLCFQKAASYQAINQMENATASLNDAFYYMPKNKLDQIGKMYQLQADILKDKKEFAKALFFYQKALITLKGKDATACQLAKIEVLIDLKQSINTIRLLKTQGFQEDNNIFYTTNFLLAKVFFQKKDYKNALLHYKKIKARFNGFWQKNEMNYQFIQIHNGIASVCAVQKNNAQTIQFCDMAFDKITIINQTTNDERDEFLLEQELYDTFDLAITACLAQENKEQAFLWSERSKNHLLKKYDASQTEIANAKAIQNALKEEETLLSYHVGKQDISVFILQKNKFEVQKIAISQHFQDTIIQFFNLCSNIPISNVEQEMFAVTGFQLYQTLWEKVQTNLTKNVIVVPDAYLCYLPFEALLTQAIPKESADRMSIFPFLIQQYNIRYSNSASLLPYFQMQSLPQNNGKLLAFAPSFKGEKDLSELVFNQEEVKNISPFFDTKMILGKTATLHEFEVQNADYQILHLSTHAKSDNENSDLSFIAFSRDTVTKERNLSISSIYQNHFQAELVVLSACETAIGQHYRGEGLFSISRAFQAAGARSVVASLWNVNDQQTPQLMETFYKHLQKGYSKSEALCIAKKTYLETASHSLAHPFYWTGFSFIGDDAPIQQSWGSRCWNTLCSFF
jgi:CHAT domain-containing protein